MCQSVSISNELTLFSMGREEYHSRSNRNICNNQTRYVDDEMHASYQLSLLRIYECLTCKGHPISRRMDKNYSNFGTEHDDPLFWGVALCIQILLHPFSFNGVQKHFQSLSIRQGEFIK